MKKEKLESIISYLLVIFGAAIYISLVFNNNVWLDEAFTASLVRTDMAGVLERSMADTLPPLYNIILKLSTDIFGYTIPVMKLTSVMPMIFTMILSATIVRKRHGFITSSLFTLALISMPNLLFFGVEIRMYSLGFFFATASGIFAYECVVDSCRKNWIIFTVLSVLAGYSHHFAFVTVGLVYFYLLIHFITKDRKNIKRFIYCLIGTFILYFPCLVVTLKQFKSVSGYFSMPEVTFPVFIKYCRYPYTVGFTPLTIILSVSVLVLIITSLINLYKEKNSDILFYAVACFMIYYCVLLFGTVISKIMTANIFVDRYLFFAIGLLWLFYSIAVTVAKKKYIQYGAFILVFLCGISGYIKEYRIEYATNADLIIDFLDKNVQKGDVLYTLEDNEEMAFCLPFYEENLTNFENLKEAIRASENNNSDIFVSVIDYYDYDFEEIKDLGYTPEYEGNFSFDRYNVDLYKLVK